ncbi:dihydrolipoamide acetyltransferase family protein [Chakrabartyella piscis]|uniref:dihydrolipoamide acetyltransferase family protein n=1 Tax=Chakrabartyella piscis TaxID=2918914 RepID=UPI00295865E9|nr:dihydrolipoamide acetyltransferase family protein [Chakrabartyella piscis]
MAIEMTLPKIGVNMTEAVIAEWYIKPGDEVKEGDAILNAETDKATQEIYATASGTVGKLVAEVGQTVQTQEAILLFLEAGETVESLASAAPKAEVKEEDVVDGYGMNNDGNEAKQAAIAAVQSDAAQKKTGKIRISPLAKKLAKDNGIDLALLSPKEAGDRIVKADVLAYIANPPAPVAAAAPAEQGVTIPKVGKANLPEGQEILEVIPVKGIRKVIAERMTESVVTKPSVPHTATICMEPLIELRKSLKAIGVNVGFNELLMKVCSRALSEHKLMNAVMSENEIWLLKDINIGIAVDTEKGLVVPVIKKVNHKSLAEISNEFRSCVSDIQDGNMSPDMLSGGTFTISNLGSFGVEFFAPILNPPECGILGVGKAVRTFVPDENDQPVLKTLMKVTLVFDHRIIDGAPAAKCLQRIVELAENPQLLI